MSRSPVHEVRIGLIKACVWQNKRTIGDQYNVTIVRLYKNGDVWKESAIFGRNDLLVVAKVADMAHTWIALRNQTNERISDDKEK